MGVNHSRQAVVSKIRARYGRFFTTEDYRTLAASPGVPDLALALAEHPDYASVVNRQSTTHRDTLEQLLRRQYYTDLESLLRFDRFLGADFYQFIMGEVTAEAIMSFAIHYNAGTLSRWRVTVPSFFCNNHGVDIRRLSGVKDLSQLTALFGGHPLLPAIAESLPAPGEPINLTQLEHALAVRVHHLFKKADKSSHAPLFRWLYATYIDVKNLQAVFRQKEFFGGCAPPLLPDGHLDESYLRQLYTLSYPEMLKKISASRYGKYVRGKETSDITLWRMLYARCRRVIRFETEIPALLLAYTLLSKNRLSCLITITEGVRYNMPPQTTLSLLPISETR